MHFFLILQLWLAPFFNISSLSDLKYNLHKYREKSDFFGKNRIFSEKYRIFSEKSAIFADFFPIFLQKIFPPENLFHHHRKPIFRRKIGRKNRFFCPCMTQPEGFVQPKNSGKVCKLQRSIYGLKQASRSWNLRFDESVKGFGFVKNEDEPCVYKKISGSTIVFLVLYVDDILLIGNDIPTFQNVKSWLGKCFSMKDLGEAAYILGIKIYRDRSKRLIGLSQSTYIDKVLKRFSMQDSKRGYLPMSHGITLSKSQCPNTKDEQERMSKIPYASTIGSIMYVMLCTRPDVSYALSITSRYQSNPGESHWTVVKNILKYLRRSKDMFLVYGGLEDDLVVNCYTYASFQSDKDDFRLQSRYVSCLNGGAVSWKSSKQSTVADSTT